LARVAQQGVRVARLSAAQRQQWQRLTAAETGALLAAAGPRAEPIYQAILAGKQAFKERRAAIPLEFPQKSLPPLGDPWRNKHRRTATASAP
jgi:antitoxin (DNA-binding transcriptional repressor) of toxin-antitoxin stability system